MKITREKRTLTGYGLIVASGLMGAAITIGAVSFFDMILKLIWENLFNLDTVEPSRSLVGPLMLVLGGLSVGFFIKRYGKAGEGLEEIAQQVAKSGGIQWRQVPRTLALSLLSIASGASLGPEAPSTVASAGSASWLAEKANKGLWLKKAMGVASLVGMIGGFFVLTNEAGGFGLPADSGSELHHLPAAFIFGVAGGALGVLVAGLMLVSEPLFKHYDKKPVHLALIGSIAVAIITFAAPLTMFSGQYVMPKLIAGSAIMTVIGLMALALAKLLSTSILLRSGFFGGPIFPTLFAGTALGLALNHLMGSPDGVAVAASVAGLLTITLRKPLIAGLMAIAVTNTAATPSVLVGVAGAMLIHGAAARLRPPSTII